MATYFLLISAWMAIIFTSFEILALTIGLNVYTRYALDCGNIMIVDKRLLFWRSWRGKAQSHEFNTIWTKLVRSESTGRDLVSRTSAKEVPIGFFIDVNEQQQFEKTREISWDLKLTRRMCK
ncbi:MAG: DUF2244 domain-containing protein [Polynucleobacter sp.]|uniref:DUF2244 domain-containing protein n=1 Tax=Polynucleobacter sp. TaxID=2029855 RepID=UPI00272412B2|nr:DUF2244 domain-containing protein [Polynucleobacter sp.]MDO8713279.1 DUF2244 domain-containing protein [Polynucleobacter sp.]